MDRRLFIVSSVAVTGCNSVIPNLPSSADASASSISPTTIQITPASPLPAATQNTAYVVQLVPTGGVAPYTWSLMSATPDTGFWLSINSSTGVLGGTPGTAETETVNITVKDSAGDGGSQSFSLTVNAAGPALQITTNSPLPAALVGSGYSVAISATGGATPYTWSISSDTPDSGSWLSINPSTGVLSGTPGTPETETVVVKITDNAGQSYSQNFSLAVNAASLQITSSSPLPAATVGAAYSDTVDAKGGIPPYTWSITSDAPDTGSWLSINPSTGVLSGTPKTAETESVVVKITDSASHSSSQSFSLTVNATASTLQITTGASLPAATVGSAYTEGLSATGGATPYTWSISSDAPDTGSWLSINSSTGVLSGTPGTAETETVVVKVTDSASHNSTQSFSLVVNAKPLSISTSSSLPAATVGSVYSDTVAATGGVPPYTWSISSDAPDTGSWLSINASTGVLSGTPGTAETETVVVKVTDSASHSSTQSFSLVVNTKALSISTSSPLPAATVGSAYSDTVAATGGVPPYTWSISSDAPDTGSWLSINPSTGVLSGTPGTAETETVVVKVTDSASHTSSQSFSLTVGAGSLQITNSSPLPGAVVGAAYAVTVAATGGTAPYTWSITSDAPDTGSWLSINPSTGVLSGTPGTPEIETVVVKVTDSASHNFSQSFSLSVSAAQAGNGAYDGVIKVGTGANAGKFVNGAGQVIQLRGANMSGLEFVAIQGWSAADPWGGTAPDWAVYQTWKPNIARFPLNAASWLGLTTYNVGAGSTWTGQNNLGIGNGTADPGGNYKQALYTAIANAQAAGCYCIIDLHWCAPQITLGGVTHYLTPAGQSAFADQSTGLPFWESIAQIFGTQATPQPGINNNAILFELFNEPYLDADGGTQSAGSPDLALLNGGTDTVVTNSTGGTYQLNATWTLAGYQALLTAIRGYGAQNVCIINGNSWTQQLQNYLTWWPTDTLSPAQLAAGWHPYNQNTYPYSNGNVYPVTGADPGGSTASAVQWANAVMAAGHPLICTEDGGFGGSNCTNNPPEPHIAYMNRWADSTGASWMFWEWTGPQTYGTTATFSDVGGADFGCVYASDGTTILPILGEGTQAYYWMVSGTYTGAA